VAPYESSASCVRVFDVVKVLYAKFRSTIDVTDVRSPFAGASAAGAGEGLVLAVAAGSGLANVIQLVAGFPAGTEESGVPPLPRLSLPLRY
jgi:hypothetical protein